MNELQNHIKKTSIRKLADELGVRYQSIQDWLSANRVPAERVLAVERVTGISRHALRPDIYPVERNRKAA